MNYIVRAVFNRPEMFAISLKSEEIARKRYCNDEYKTLFCIEHGAPKIIEDIIEQYYKFDYAIVKRPHRHFGWGNILEGFNQVNQDTDSYMLNFEDDCLLHSTYFEYIDKALSVVDNKCAVINSTDRTQYNKSGISINQIRKTRLFEAPCCLIFKGFYNKYVKPYANNNYYKNRRQVISKVNTRNGNNKLSKYRQERRNLFHHVGWDGLVNRLVDSAAIEENMYCVSPLVTRMLHIGFYGQNRPGKFPVKDKDFAIRLEKLSEIIKDPALMARLDGTYKDYTRFNPELDNWNGEINII